MTANIQNKKFDFHVFQDNTTWTTEIIRRVTATRTHVSKKKEGFGTEAEAKEWGENELKAFLINLNKRNKRDSKKTNDNESS